jgi:hypothetical protein
LFEGNNMAQDLELAEGMMTALRRQLPHVAEQTVASVIAEVPSYTDAFQGPMGRNIEQAVQLALAGFLNLAAPGSDPGTPLAPVMDGAYALGRGEARSGRSMDALLAAYRIGARVAWREFARVAVAGRLQAETMAQFAELVFAYIDQLSAASVAGHSDELATSGRVRERYLERLGRALLDGSSAEHVLAAAERAEWTPPETLTAVLLPDAQVRSFLSLAHPSTLQVPSESADGLSVLLVPAAGGAARRPLLRALQDRSAVVGPCRPWLQVRASYDRAVRARQLDGHTGLLDTDEQLTALVLNADPEALADLTAQVLAPLAVLRPAAAEKLVDTLRSWLLHHGRREDVAADLFVHPQTVRYRMGQLRELYGEALDDPESVLRLTVALGAAGATTSTRAQV